MAAVMLRTGYLGATAIDCKIKFRGVRGRRLGAGGWQGVWVIIFWQPQNVSSGPQVTALNADAGQDNLTSCGLQVGQNVRPATVTAGVALCTFSRPQMQDYPGGCRRSSQRTGSRMP